MRKTVLFLLMFVAAMQTAMAEVKGKEISYTAKGVTMKGYIAYDDAVKGRRPGVLVVHEWWGLNDYARRRARMLAELGYTALAVDMYGNGKQATHPDDAGKFAAEVSKNLDLERARFQAALRVLKKQRTVDPDRIAAVGYCFGGGVVLAMAREGPPLLGVASFHGSLGTDAPAQPGKVKAKIIVFTGADDPMAPPALVDKFKAEMDKAGADYKVVSFPGAKHSFTNPDADEYGKKFNLPLAYNAAADKESWDQLKNFLAGIFAGKK
jgi:dienelactone hydrolase